MNTMQLIVCVTMLLSGTLYGAGTLSEVRMSPDQEKVRALAHLFDKIAAAERESIELYQLGHNFVWNNPYMTPQEACDMMHTAVANRGLTVQELLAKHAALGVFLNSLNGSETFSASLVTNRGNIFLDTNRPGQVIATPPPVTEDDAEDSVESASTSEE
jgi:hypothetical protein